MSSTSRSELPEPASDTQQPSSGLDARMETMSMGSTSQDACATDMDATEQPSIATVDSGGSNDAGTYSASSVDVGTGDSALLEKSQASGDDKIRLEYKLAVLQAQLELLQSEDDRKIRRLTNTVSQLQDAQRAADEIVANSIRLIESIEIKHAQELSDLQKRLRHAESAKAEYHQNFQDAQDLIFSMQSRRSDITEDEAAQEYGVLCANVEQWVEHHLDDVLELDEKLFARSKVDIESGAQLIELIEITPGGMRAKRILDTLPYYLRNAIMNFICHAIFEQEPYNASDESWQLLHTIESSMRTLEPRRDRAAIRAWRSETLTALYASPKYKDRRRLRAAELTRGLCGCLQVLLLGASKERLDTLKKSIYDDLIIPSFKLSEKFHLSPKLFSLSSRGVNGGREKIAHELDMYDCRSILESGKPVKAAKDGVDYSYIIDICQGLSCRTIKGDSISPPKPLKKGQVLVFALKRDTKYNVNGETALSIICDAVQEHRKRAKRG